MFSTWDRNGAEASAWRDSHKGPRPQQQQPLSRFLAIVDRLYYAAAIGLVASVVALLIDY